MKRRALLVVPFVLFVLAWSLPAHAVQRSILNPSFETPALTGACVAQVNQSLTGGWRTTETVTAGSGSCGAGTGTGGVLEYWGNSVNGVPADNGANHIELNAYNPARVSQSLCLVAGDQVDWQFSHRARDAGLGAGSRDVALFSVDSSINSVRTANTSAAGGTGGSCPASSGGVTGNSCAATTVGTWGRYSGSFTWTGSSGTHDIGFEAISNSTNSPAAGNFLDNIQFTLKPMVEFDSASAASYVVAESGGTVTLKLRVAGIVPAGGVQVPFTVSGTATSGSDYTALATASLTVPAGNYGAGTVVTASPTLTLIDDASVEDTETVVFTLGASTPTSPYVLSSTSTCGGAATATATVTILDNDVNLTLTKAIVGVPADGGKFNLQIAGGTPSGGTNPANEVGHGGTTGAVRVDTGATVTLAETAGTATLLTNYITTLACTDGNGTAVTVSGSGTSRTLTTPIAGTTAATALTAVARTLSCTYTNTMRPKVTVEKLSVGGSGTFSFSLTGVTAGTDTVTTVASGAAVASPLVHVGTGGTAATLTEVAASAVGYTTATRCVDAGSAITGNTTPITGTGTAITLPAVNMKAGADYTCTFTNTAVSALKLVKTSSTPSFAVGVPASYTLTLSNTGVFATQADTAVTDTVPATLTLGTMPAGCSAVGQVVSCTVPTGLPAATGVAAFVIPVTPLSTAVPSVSNTATANGGGDPSCTGTGNCTSTLVTPVLALPRVTVRKVKTNVTGTQAFGYTLTGVTNPADTVSVVTANTAVASAVVHTGAVGVEASITEATVPVGWPANPAAVSCLDAAAATSGNATTNLGTLAGATVTLPASAMRAAANITCTFTNTALPVLTLAKTATATVAPGGAIAYGLSLTNSGAIATGTAVVVREQLPPGVVATSVVAGAGVTSVNCGTLPSTAGAALGCTMTLPEAGIPALAAAARGFTLNATAPSTAALAGTGTVLTNHASTNVVGSGTAATAPGAGCTSDGTVSCASAATTLVSGPGVVAQSGVRTVTDNQLANGSAQDVLEAMVRDVAQNPVAGALATFAATPSVAFNGGAVGAAGSCTTDASGRCQVMATSTLLGTKSSAASIAAGAMTGSFTAGGNTYQSSPASYTFLLIPPGGSQSGLRVVTDNQVANGVAQDVLEVFVRDAGGNPVGTGALVSFGATPNVAFNGGVVGAAGSCTTTAASTCQVTATSTVPTTYATTPVTVAGVPLAGSFTAGGSSYLPSPQPYAFLPRPTVTITKVSINDTGTFNFSLVNLGIASTSVTTVMSNMPVTSATTLQGSAGVIATVSETAVPGFTTSARCVDSNAAFTGNTTAIVSATNAISIPAANMKPGASYDCTFTNTASASFGFCDARLWLGQGSPTTTLYDVDTGSNPFVFTPVGSAANITHNGIDFNPADNYLWASRGGTNRLVRIGTDGVPADMGPVTGLPATGFNGGAFGPTGNILYLHSGTDAEMYAVNVTTMTATRIALSSAQAFADFGWVNGRLYTVTTDTGRLISIHPTTGAVTLIGPARGAITFGAVFGAPNGLFASDNNGGFYQVNLTNGVRTLLSSSPASGSNDGAHCPAAPIAFGADVSLTKSDNQLQYAPGTDVTYTIVATNNGPFGVQGATLADPLPTGIATATWTCTATTGAQCTASGTGAIGDTALNLPVGGKATYVLKLTVPADFTGDLINTVRVTLPSTAVDPTPANNVATDTDTQETRVTLRKISLGAVGSFGFSGDNGVTAQSIVTTVAGAAVSAIPQALAASGVATTLTESPPPANYTLTDVSCTGLGTGGTATPDLANRKVLLDAAATVAGSQIVCTFSNTYAPPYPKVQIVKTAVGGVGSNVFGFALSGLSAPTDTITVVGAGTISGSATLVGTAGVEASIKETVPTGWPANPVSASCVDAASATPTVAFGTLVANQLTIPAARMVAGAVITCTFTNSFGFSVRGRVFNDNGVGAGTANDGLLNGGEAGIAGVAVRLTNCAATVLASAVTDGTGHYTLAVPFATAAAAPLCVEETNPAAPSAWTSTGASLGGAALPSGSATTVAGAVYTYTRLGTPDRIAFIWNGSGHAGLDFGDVAPNTFAADGAKTGLPGSTVSYPHTFKAQTGGAVSFGIPTTVDTPALTGWSGKIFADTGCTGSPQAGAALLFPPSVPVAVVAGQSLCVVMQEFIPATAMNGYNDNSTVQASFVFTNATPGLSASYTVHDITTVSDSALALKKEVRNVTQGDSFGVNNQAKSGEVLEYRITYTNNGTTPITGLAVNDTTPSHTRFVGAQADTTPTALGACDKRTPANALPAPVVPCGTAQSAGGAGPLRWGFAGVLAPGASGTVSFTVQVD